MRLSKARGRAVQALALASSCLNGHNGTREPAAIRRDTEEAVRVLRVALAWLEEGLAAETQRAEDLKRDAVAWAVRRLDGEVLTPQDRVRLDALHQSFVQSFAVDSGVVDGKTESTSIPVKELYKRTTGDEMPDGTKVTFEPGEGVIFTVPVKVQPIETSFFFGRSDPAGDGFSKAPISQDP